ncbi:MAG: hypothetical protein R3Y60_01000 [bacterium]
MIEKKFASELRKKSVDDLKKYQFIGAEIKSSRLKLSKTLDAIGNVNRSISYISKIENNKIVPNKRCLMELCDELFISKEDLESMECFDEYILEAIETIYFKDEIKMKEIFSKYESFKNTRTNLIKGLYYFMFDDHTQIKSVIKSLVKIESSLSIEDYLVYILLCVKDFILDKNVVQAYKILSVVLESKTATDTLYNVFKMMEFDLKISFNLFKFDNDYFDVIKMHVLKNNIIRIEECVKKYERMQIDLLDSSITENEIKRLSTDELRFYAYCLRGEIDKAQKYFDENIADEFRLLYYFKLNELEEIKNMINTSLTEENMILANAYKYSLEGNAELYRTFLINICIPYFKGVVKVKMLLHFYNILLELSSKTAKYKESNTYGREIVKMLQELSVLIS